MTKMPHIKIYGMQLKQYFQDLLALNIYINEKETLKSNASNFNVKMLEK